MPLLLRFRIKHTNFIGQICGYSPFWHTVTSQHQIPRHFPQLGLLKLGDEQFQLSEMSPKLWIVRSSGAGRLAQGETEMITINNSSISSTGIMASLFEHSFYSILLTHERRRRVSKSIWYTCLLILLLSLACFNRRSDARSFANS